MTKIRYLNEILKEFNLSQSYQVRYVPRYGNFCVMRLADFVDVARLGGHMTKNEVLTQNLKDFCNKTVLSVR